MSDEALYESLTAPFDETYTAPGAGGITLTYISGEQVISRLNEVFGPLGWSFNVQHQGARFEDDCVWVHGRLEATFDGQTAVREQIGSQKLKRFRSNDPEIPGKIIDLGDDYKAAATDALKKCAQGFGVGLYLSKRTQQPVNTGYRR